MLADYFALDDSGKFNVIGGFGQVSSATYPARIGDRVLALVLERGLDQSVSEDSIHVVVHGGLPGSTLSEMDVLLPEAWTASSDEAELSVRVALEGLVLPTPGTYFFDIFACVV